MSAAQIEPATIVAITKLRSKVIQQVRQFFYDRNVLEVETPTLSQASIPDPNIYSLTTDIQFGPDSKTYFLQTSPEFHMKRLLASGCGSIFQICKAFRNSEAGSNHNPEFTILEWYQLNYGIEELMTETSDLLTHLMQTQPASKISYQAIFKQFLNIDPLNIDMKTLREFAIALDAEQYSALDFSHKDDWLNVLFANHIEPHLGTEQPTMIYHYPASQSALARINSIDSRIAERFEVFYKGVELGNGFNELTDPDEQLRRFESNNIERCIRNLPTIPIDFNFIRALKKGLPMCSGIAMGLDRIMMLITNKRHINEILAFPFEKA